MPSVDGLDQQQPYPKVVDEDDGLGDATLGSIDWLGHRSVHGNPTEDHAHVTPAEFDALSGRSTTTVPESVSDRPE